MVIPRCWARSMSALAALTAIGPAMGDDAGGRPNVVLFVIDDLGWRDLACMGSDFHETPRIDALASAGMTFTDAYANAPNCAPSRACLISGLYGPRHGVYTVGTSERGRARLRRLVPSPNTTELAARFVTIAEALEPAGYATAIMGKWHLGPDPTRQGFDVNVGGSRAGSPPGGYFAPYKNPAMEDGPDGEYLTDRLAEEAVRFINDREGEPFFLYLPHYAVHTPLQAPEEVAASYREKPPGALHDHPTYAAMIDRMDAAVGRVLDALDRRGLSGRTAVIFTSDNGGYAPATSMEPLRGSKGMLYEGGVRVPLIVRWPGVVEPGSTSEEPVIGLDLFPTILEIAGVPTPDGAEPDGRSLVPLLNRDADSLDREALYWHFPAYLQGNRDADGPWRTTPAGAIRMGDWKLLEFFEDGRIELYNLADDLGESDDLASERTEIAEDLHRRLRTWRASTGAPVPAEPNPEFDPEARPTRRPPAGE